MNLNKIVDACKVEMAPPGCPNIFPPPKPTPVVTCNLVKDEVCGNIEQPCDGSFVEYWRVVGLPVLPSGTVTVYNGSDCIMSVRAVIQGSLIDLFTITEKNQTKAVTVSGIESLDVQCLGGATGATCSGRFCLTLHYQKDCVEEVFE
ncbi:hypothetical protein N781_09345 [Pontibacillus halophilus JSM 076056 = DSM 19796]|uniref:Endospore appendages core domain-containing protein n=1 Tax=Pontibacillus halophilus JSM 076056 = DSM 19796 TaxID=1385510 RepID=A0A0A5GB91_9BACI|nr:S-Ena type endospore appendage [Pontibacillus halophilus]KGX89314.1 hypothetical protein N781_09345 [Pontibacillus halophilus JSM 076056 = DSM 19796]